MGRPLSRIGIGEMLADHIMYDIIQRRLTFLRRSLIFFSFYYTLATRTGFARKADGRNDSDMGFSFVVHALSASVKQA